MKTLRKGQVRIQNIISSLQTGTYNESLQVYTTEKSRKQNIAYVRQLKLEPKKS